ncbi:MAG: hypothetical protein RLZZ360_2 [Candidatus Parcubacteria bacterium]|jgi:hypothetical protein
MILFLTAFSIWLIYYNIIVLQNYSITTTPSGPDTSDYLLIEEIES